MKRLVSMALLASGMAGLPMVGLSGETGERSTFNVGFSPNLFTEVNKADAVASIKVWADTILSRRNINLASDPIIYADMDLMKSALLAGEVDFVSMLTEEFFMLEDEVALDHFFYTSLHGTIAEEYLLLVRRDSGIENLAALQGKSMALLTGARQGLARIWTETLLMKEGFAGLDDFFLSVDAQPKTSRSVMNVFFGKSDACLVNRAGFETMVELNPQIGKNLKVIAESPSFVPALMCIRRSYASTLKEELLTGVRELDSDPRGQQILTVFKADKLVEGSTEELATAREWIEAHTLLKNRDGQTETRELGGLK